MPSNNSYVDANNMNPLQVADLIKRLSDPSNEDEYNKYLAFKDKPLSTDFERIALMSYNHPNILCRYVRMSMSMSMSSLCLCPVYVYVQSMSMLMPMSMSMSMSMSSLCLCLVYVYVYVYVYAYVYV